MLIDPEQLCVLIQLHGMRSQNAPHTRAGLPPELKVGGLHGAGGGDQIGDLVLGRAGTAPVTDVVVGWGLDAVLDLANPGEVLAGRCCQRPG